MMASSLCDCATCMSNHLRQPSESTIRILERQSSILGLSSSRPHGRDDIERTHQIWISPPARLSPRCYI
ncbi:hypothetical protein CY34DRAFT_735466 [Suillus luteus UH-Slu-Lm8-n1]|uniref:Uncharacterized protein n=1 Tax=Suillus luteus UH-Slu-Lm8-n1 TaxID=930992 RepID=A0A0D0BIR8_9AGAM|nr:hypothetical protein CY34DRAFT_735466 [Suillus luteus UH-Slu-Lm8-n1]